MDVSRGGEEKEEKEECPLVNKSGVVKEGMVQDAPLVPKLIALMESLEDERQVVSNLIARINGQRAEMSHEQQLQQTIANLSLQLEQERRKSALLERELELLRRKNTHIKKDDSSVNVNKIGGGTGTESSITTDQ